MSITQYLRDSFEEFNHVAWPTRKQTIRLTVIVIGFIIFSALFIGSIDLLFTYFVTSN